MENKSEKKTVIITGGNKGIGACIAKAFLRLGYQVVVGARSSLPAGLKGKALFIKTDVRFEKSMELLARYALKETGRIDVFINCAGFSQWMPLGKISEKFWEEMINVNLKGTFWGCKIAARHLRFGGCIINISSLAGKRGSSNNSVYCASKFGINGITQSLAKELGANGIRVNAVCPVYVETEAIIEALKEINSPAGGKDVKRYLKKFALENSALKRLPTPDEIANVCLFLASENASAVTGQCINVDCGVLPQ
jgi:NAD(P)-dependent dehydrogenase (short-subunit alcohol dehydrogenase family)